MGTTQNKATTPAPAGQTEEKQVTVSEELLQKLLGEINALNQKVAESDAQKAAEIAQLKAAQADLELRRTEAVREVETEPVTVHLERREADKTNKILQAQELFTVYIPRDPRAIDPRNPDKPQTETVQINGASKYVIVKDEFQQVPESVYLVLVAAGLVKPQRQQDMGLWPRISVKRGEAADAPGFSHAGAELRQAAGERQMQVMRLSAPAVSSPDPVNDSFLA